MEKHTVIVRMPNVHMCTEVPDQKHCPVRKKKSGLDATKDFFLEYFACSH